MDAPEEALLTRRPRQPLSEPNPSKVETKLMCHIPPAHLEPRHSHPMDMAAAALALLQTLPSVVPEGVNYLTPSRAPVQGVSHLLATTSRISAYFRTPQLAGSELVLPISKYADEVGAQTGQSGLSLSYRQSSLSGVVMWAI